MVVTKIWINGLRLEREREEGWEKMETNSEMKAKVLVLNGRSGSVI